MEYNRIICGDAVTEMKKFPNESFDLIITSPPYNLKNSNFGSKWKNAALRNGYDTYDDNLPYDEYIKWQRTCLTEMLRLIPEDGAIFYNHKWRIQNGLLCDRHEILGGFPVRQIIIWHRNGGMNFNDSFFLPTYEVIYLIAKPKFKLVPKANAYSDVWEFPSVQHSDHPAPFPVALVERIILSTSAKTVLDPFSGSGTTAVAAKRLHREYIGIELSQKYCDMAVSRLSKLDRKFF